MDSLIGSRTGSMRSTSPRNTHPFSPHHRMVSNRFREDEDALSHIIEFSLSLIIFLFILAGYFTALDNEFIIHSPNDARREEDCIRYSDVIIGDTGSALTDTGNTTYWESLSPEEMDENLTRPGLAAENSEFGVISHGKIMGLRNVTYPNMRSILKITKFNFNIEITELNGSRIVYFGYSSSGAKELSQVDRIVHLQDGNDSRTVKLFFRLFKGTDRRTLIRINEIMYHPQEGKDEWIELYNPSYEAVEVSNFALYTQGNTTFDQFTGEPMFIPGKSYGIIVTTDETLDQYNVPDTTVILRVKDNNLGQGGLRDDSMDLFIAGESLRSEYYFYNNTLGGNGNGRTLEWSVTSNGWQESQLIGGTPGEWNSAD